MDEHDWHDDRPDWQEFIFDEQGNPICEHTVFENSPYGGRCQGACGSILPFYLNECSNCGFRVCNYCAAARSFVPREQNDDTVNGDVASDTALDSEQGQTQVHDEELSSPSLQLKIMSMQLSPLTLCLVWLRSALSTKVLTPSIHCRHLSQALSDMNLREEGHCDVVNDFGHRLRH